MFLLMLLACYEKEMEPLDTVVFDCTYVSFPGNKPTDTELSSLCDLYSEESICQAEDKSIWYWAVGNSYDRGRPDRFFCLDDSGTQEVEMEIYLYTNVYWLCESEQVGYFSLCDGRYWL